MVRTATKTHHTGQSAALPTPSPSDIERLQNVNSLPIH